MSTPPSPDGHGDGRTDDLDRIQADIEATRQRLSETVDELSARLDVQARAREKAYRARDTAIETYRENPPLVIGAAVALVGVLVGMIILRRKRATSKRDRGRKR